MDAGFPKSAVTMQLKAIALWRRPSRRRNRALGRQSEAAGWRPTDFAPSLLLAPTLGDAIMSWLH
jgi:hypothetical protein